jgi:hypothetical protein
MKKFSSSVSVNKKGPSPTAKGLLKEINYNSSNKNLPIQA